MGSNCCSAEKQADDTNINLDKRVVPDKDAIVAKFVTTGQSHVFSAWKSLGHLERENLLSECAQFDVELINQLYYKLVANAKVHVSQTQDKEQASFDTVEPELVVNRVGLTSYEQSIYLTAGHELIRQGKVGVVILAGG